jgi:hypothetical protein
MDRIMKYLLITLGIIILLGISFKSYYPTKMRQTFFSLVDICSTYEGYKNYPKVIGKWDLGSVPKSLTINVDGRIIFSDFVADRTDVDFTLGHGSTLRLIGTTCNAEGQCVDFDQSVYAFNSGEFTNCQNSCNTYNWPSQCSAARYMPISYNCYNLCAYDGDVSFGISSLKPSKSYTITIKEFKYLRYGSSTWQSTNNFAIDLVYSVIYDPSDKPWERICNPGEKQNFRCEGNYKVWDECSSDGKSWFTNREYCSYGCFNGECNQYAPTTTTTLPPQERPQPTFDYRLIPIIIAVILIIIIVIFLLLIGRKKYG